MAAAPPPAGATVGTPAPRTAPADPVADRTAQGAWWDRARTWWHLAFAGLLAVSLVMFVRGGAPPAAYGLLAALAVWYRVAGVPALVGPPGRGGPVYLAVAFALFAVLAYLQQSALLLLYALYPQTFALARRFRTAIATVALLSALFSLVLIARAGWTAAAFRNTGLDGVISLVFAVLIGAFVTGIARESTRRAALITELETARTALAQAHHQAGVQAERERLAHEIHDTLAQGFTSLLMLVQMADAAVGTDPAAAHRQLALAERTARENLAEARALVTALGPVDLQGADLGEAIRRVAGRLAEEIGVATTVTRTGESRSLPPNTQVVLVRALQEGLANIRRHAAATQVTVRLHYGEAGTVLEVSDDGRGFDPQAVDGFGLRGMRARVEQVGGTLGVDSSAGHGTTVRVTIP